MGLFIPKPHLGPNEAVQLHMTANMSRGSLAVGGRLFITDQRVIFSPSIVQRSQKWERALKDLASASVAETAPGETSSGGLRRRLVLSFVDGQAEYFVVNGVEELVTKINGMVSPAT